MAHRLTMVLHANSRVATDPRKLFVSVPVDNEYASCDEYVQAVLDATDGKLIEAAGGLAGECRSLVRASAIEMYGRHAGHVADCDGCATTKGVAVEWLESVEQVDSDKP